MSAASAGQLRVEREGHLAWVVFDHPERRNALTGAMWRALPGALADLAKDEAIRVVVLRGEGEKAFVSGADISEFQEQRVGNRAVEYEERNVVAWQGMADFAKPLLAMIHGFCIGGGLGIAINADVRYAAEDAVFAVPAARLGLGYPPDSLRTLVELVGPSVAKELFFTARRFGAEEALRLGVVNAVLPKVELESHVRSVADQIAEGAPLTLRAGKLAVRQLALDPDERSAEAVRDAVVACFSSEDYAEGVRAFLEKRRPEFKGR